MDFMIQEINDTRAIPLELLHLADPSDEMLDSYLDRSVGFVCLHDSEIIGALLMIPTRPYTMEIMNISVYEKYHNQGIGRQLIEKAIQKAKDLGMRKMEIGTGNPGVVQMLLYQKCGFRIVGIEFDYFRNNYEERIIENGIECRDMIRMELFLETEKN